jgi:hypothetical protein
MFQTEPELYTDGVCQPEHQINYRKWFGLLKQAEGFGLVFQVTLQATTVSAYVTEPVYEQFNQQVNDHITKYFSWAPTNQDITAYETYHWRLAQGGNRPKDTSRYQHIREALVQRPQFTISNLKTISSKVENALHQRPLLIICESNLVPIITKCSDCGMASTEPWLPTSQQCYDRRTGG